MNHPTTCTPYEAAIAAVKRGWAVIPVHGVNDKHPSGCTCRRPTCSTPAKHPVEDKWQQSRYLSLADCYSLWMESLTPRNMGILTGEPSGVWVLDIDPRNGGNETLATLIAEHGELPETYTVRTGGGGRHYYFLMPDFPVGNSKPVDGIDIKGTAGQVLGPGSVSGSGTYWVENDAPVAAAPEWVLDLVKKEKEKGSVEITLAGDLPHYEDLTPFEQLRCSKYAVRVIEAECDAYATVKWGDGSDQLFRSCCNILEIVQSPWNEATPEYALQRLEVARVQRYEAAMRVGRVPAGQTTDELDSTWRSAAKKVRGQGRPLPIDRDEHSGVVMDIPFSASSPAPSGISPFAQPGDGDEGEVLEGVAITDADRAQFAAAEAAARWEAAVQQKAQELKLLDAAREYNKTGGLASGVTEDAVDILMAKMLDADDLDDLPNPEPLIVDVLDLDSESWIIGAPGGFKSFVALDWAAHVGAGLDWQGKRTTQGTVLYVVAEGAKGIKLRKRAWCEAYGPMKNVKFLPEPVQVTDKQGWAVLIEACRRIKPVMIILDTQARITVELNENTSEMGVAIDAIRQMRAATGACVLVVHHTGRNGADARGWSGIDGAQDSEIKVIRPEDHTRKLLTAEIVFEKQKDAGEDEAFKIQMREHDWGRDPITGRKLSSLSIKPMPPFSQPAPEKLPSWQEKLTENQKLVLDALRTHTNAKGITLPALLQLINDRAEEGVGEFIKRTSLRSALLALADKVEKGRPIVLEEGSRYILAEHLDE